VSLILASGTLTAAGLPLQPAVDQYQIILLGDMRNSLQYGIVKISEKEPSITRKKLKKTAEFGAFFMIDLFLLMLVN